MSQHTFYNPITEETIQVEVFCCPSCSNKIQFCIPKESRLVNAQAEAKFWKHRYMTLHKEYYARLKFEV